MTMRWLNALSVPGLARSYQGPRSPAYFQNRGHEPDRPVEIDARRRMGNAENGLVGITTAGCSAPSATSQPQKHRRRVSCKSEHTRYGCLKYEQITLRQTRISSRAGVSLPSSTASSTGSGSSAVPVRRITTAVFQPCRRRYGTRRASGTAR